MRIKNIILVLSLITILISACSKGPQPINYGEDECEFCKMMVMDKRYGAELVTDKGKIYFFDSIECLVGYLDNKSPFFISLNEVTMDSPCLYIFESFV